MPEEEWNFTAGSLTGFTVRLLTQPFDVLKIRFQLQVEPLRRTPSSYYSGMTQAIGRILQEEGVPGLWKGHVPGQLLSITFCGVEFATFYGLSNFFSNHALLNPTGGRDLLMGSLSGIAATTCIQPLDVMRTRLIAQGREKAYTGLLRGLAHLINTEGMIALWRGLGPSLLLIIPQTAVTFATYEKMKRSFKSIFLASNDQSCPDKHDKLFPLVAGGLAGLTGKTVVYPIDLVKKRLEIRGFEAARQTFGQLPLAYTAASYKRLGKDFAQALGVMRAQLYASFFCLKDIFRHEGPIGLFKGWQPAALKALLSTGMTFMFFEQFKQMLRSLSHTTYG